MVEQYNLGWWNSKTSNGGTSDGGLVEHLVVKGGIVEQLMVEPWDM